MSSCRIDAFEAGAYDRQTHTVVVEGYEKHEADAYVLKSDFHYMVTDREWDPRWFAREALPVFMRDCRTFR